MQHRILRIIMAAKITYFVHGTTTDNEQDLATGWLPGELSGCGIKFSAMGLISRVGGWFK
ncbi:hypothetical protein J4479_05360 [Candidatus Woesearchaeota archaeon]|nr:hypothetical protein [Candidatus Woesearchaeota archaeon]